MMTTIAYAKLRQPKRGQGKGLAIVGAGQVELTQGRKDYEQKAIEIILLHTVCDLVWAPQRPIFPMRLVTTVADGQHLVLCFVLGWVIDTIQSGRVQRHLGFNTSRFCKHSAASVMTESPHFPPSPSLAEGLFISPA